MKILILEDEVLTANDLRKTISRVAPEAEVLDVLDSISAGVNYLQHQPAPDLLFADIELTDGLSFEIFTQVSIEVPVVFCTAYNQYALDAFQQMGIEYILKPFDDRAIARAFEKYKQLSNALNKGVDHQVLIQQLQQSLRPAASAPANLLLRQGDKITPLALADVAFFQVKDGNVYAHTFSGKKHFINQKMETLEESVGSQFFRVNRQYLIQRSAVKEASQHFNRKLLIHLPFTFAEPILVGKNKVSNFLDWLTHTRA